MISRNFGMSFILGFLLVGFSVSSVFAYPFDDLKGHSAEQYVQTLVERGIVSKSSSVFRPSDSLNRAELVKLVIEATGGIRPTLLPTKASFSDVSKDAWFYSYVEVAKKLGIVAGYSNGTFGPADPVTREQAAKIVVSALSVPATPLPKLAFTDVRGTDWAFPFITTAYNRCMIDGVSARVFNKVRNLTRAEAAKMIAEALNPRLGCRVAVGAPTTAVPTSPPTAPVSPPYGNEIPSTTSKAKISLEKLSFDGRTVPRQSSNVGFVSFKITAPSAEAVKLVNLRLVRSGVGDLRSIDKVKLFEGVLRRGTEKNLHREDGSVEFPLGSDPIIIQAGQSKIVTAYVDLQAANFGGQHRFSLAGANDITLLGLTSGERILPSTTFPLHGDYFNIVNISGGSLDVSFRSLRSTEIETGQSDVDLALIDVKETSGTEAVALKSLLLTFDGANDGAFADVWIEHNGKRISNVVERIQGEKAFFNFTAVTPLGFTVPASSNRSLRVRADLIGSKDDSISVQFKRFKSDVFALGVRFGFGAHLTQTGALKSGVLKIIGGDVSFSLSSKRKDVSAGNSAVEFGQLVITNSGEAINVDRMALDIVPSDGGNVKYLSNIRFVNVASGQTVAGPFFLPSTALDNQSHRISIDDEFIVSGKQVLTLSIRADLRDGAPPLSAYQIRFIMSGVQITGEDSGVSSRGASEASQRHVIRPSADLLSQAVVINQPKIVVSAVPDDDGFFVERTKDARLWQATLSARATSDTRIRKLVFGFEGDAAVTDIAEYSLYKVVNQQLVPLELRRSAQVSSRTVTFSRMKDADGSGGFVLPADGDVNLMLLGDVAANISGSGKRMQVVLTLSNAEIFDENGNAVSLSSFRDIKGPLMTFEKGGSFNSFLDFTTPSEHIAVSKQKNVPIGVFELEARGESVEIDRLGVLLRSVNTESPLGVDVLNDHQAVASVSLYYKSDGRPVLKRNGQVATDVPDDSGKAVFDALNLVVTADKDLVLEVRADIRGMVGTSVLRAKSGMAFQAALSFTAADTRVKGSFTGLTYSDDLIDVSKNNGNEAEDRTAYAKAVYVYSSKMEAKRALSQNKVLARGLQRDLISFQLPVVGESGFDPYLRSIRVQIIGSGSACIGLDVGCNSGNVSLYTSNGELLAVGTLASGSSESGVWFLSVGEDNGSGRVLSSDIVSIGGSTDKYLPIHKNSGVFTVRGDVFTATSREQLFISIGVNGSRPNTDSDGIEWRDGGSNGVDGGTVRWIDLGEQDKETRFIENTLRN